MKDYALFYEKLTAPLRQRPGYLKVLAVFNRLMTVLMPLVYAGVLIAAFLAGGWQRLLVYLVLPAAGFVLLSLARQRLNLPRPYETWPISPLLTKDVSGRSMPSRHVFSAALVSMTVLTLSPWLGVLFLTLSACLALTRVLGGVHYPQDVLIGYACGVLVGSLLYLL